MDGLDEFEKQLAAEKAERELQAEKADRREKKHRHYHHRERSSERHRDRDRDREHRREKERDRGENRDHGRDNDRDGHNKHGRHHSHRDLDEGDDDGHRHKRSRHLKDDDNRRERDEENSRHRDRHRHRHRSRSHDRHRDRRSRDDKANDEPSFLQTHDPKEDLPLPDDETPAKDEALLARDSWMTAPSGIEVDYLHRKEEKPKPKPKPEKREISSRELNSGVLGDLNNGMNIDDIDLPAQPKASSFKFGDDGSHWRMTKLKNIYDTAQRTGRSADEIGAETFGSLREFDDIREERMELDRKASYGKGYTGKEAPTGDLYRERKAKERESLGGGESPHGRRRYHDEHDDDDDDDGDDHDDHDGLPDQGAVKDEPPAAPRLDQTALNRMRAAMMKAKLRRAPDADKLETEYNAAMASFYPPSSVSSSKNQNQAVVLDASHSRMLAGTASGGGGSRGEVKTVSTKRGRERGTVVANDDMTLDDMVREERRTKGPSAGGAASESMRMAERIAREGSRYENDLEYMDENAERLAVRTHRTDAALKAAAVGEFQRMNAILEKCSLCHHEDRDKPQDRLPLAPLVSLATRVYLTVAPSPELNNGCEGGAVIVPLAHKQNLLECDDDEWEEVRNFMKALTRLYHDQGRDVVFYENAAQPRRRGHACMVAVPIPYETGATVSAFFREAMLSAGEEWSQHKKVVDTGKKARNEPGMGRGMAFRRSIAREAPYFHVWFDLDGGLGHVVDDEDRWPRGDLFAREILGGMVDSDVDVIKKQPRWSGRGGSSEQTARVEDFRKRWRRFDWTRVLTDGQEEQQQQ